MERVDEGQHPDRFARRLQPPRHFERDDAAAGVSRQEVRPVRLHGSDILEVGAGHLLDGFSQRADTVDARRLQAKHGLVGFIARARSLMFRTCPPAP